MAITYLSPNAKFSFPRYMPAGVAFKGTNLFLVASNSSHVVIGIASTTITFDFIYFPEFYAPSSNFYTLDHVFDWPTSQAYIAGVPTGSGAFCEWGYLPGEFLPRIIITPTAPGASLIVVDIPVLTGHWWPR